MSDWPLRKLGDVATVTAGTSAPQGDKYFDGGRFNFVRTQDVGRYGFTTSLIETKDRVNELAVREKRLKKARKGASVFPKSGASILTNSRAMLGCDSYIVSHLAIVDANKALLDDYYLHYFLRTVDFGEIAQSEEGYPSLRLSDISELDIPIPPIDEQRRIVARIEKLTRRAEEARKLMAEAENQILQFQSALLAKAFRGEL
jgi:restriction endonuclease S subunit